MIFNSRTNSDCVEMTFHLAFKKKKENVFFTCQVVLTQYFVVSLFVDSPRQYMVAFISNLTLSSSLNLWPLMAVLHKQRILHEVQCSASRSSLWFSSTQLQHTLIHFVVLFLYIASCAILRRFKLHFSTAVLHHTRSKKKQHLIIIFFFWNNITIAFHLIRPQKGPSLWEDWAMCSIE